MSDYYPNGRPRWDDQFRETTWERLKRQREARQRARDSDAMLGTKPEGLSPEGVAARAAESGIARKERP